MATRAERFKADTARKGARPASGPTTGKTRSPSRAKLMGEALPAGERRYGGASTAARNKQSTRDTGSDKSYQLEDSRAPGPPSRKSTRKSEDHVKLGTTLTGRQQLKMNSPQSKHLRRGI
jgi:hypothetical protein